MIKVAYFSLFILLTGLAQAETIVRVDLGGISRFKRDAEARAYALSSKREEKPHGTKGISEFQQDVERANKIVSATQEAQCQNLKSFTFMDNYKRYSDNKTDTDFAVKVSDKVYEQAFKNCRPESRAPASSMLYETCKNACAEFGDSKLRKAISRSSAEVKECQKICMIFTDHLSSIAAAVQTSYDLFSAKDKGSMAPDCNGHVDTSSRSSFKPKNVDSVPAVEHSPYGIAVQK